MKRFYSKTIHELAISVVALRIHPIGCAAMKILFCMFCREFMHLSCELVVVIDWR
jgi:hypothetical protein